MSRTDLLVNSATGVDVALPVAGPGVRSFAFLIDWHIRTLLAVAWYVLAALIYNRAWKLSAPLTADAAWFVYVLAPAAVIYFLYHPVLETGMRGRTPGKRMAGVQLVNRRGGTPGLGALLIRNVFRLVDCLPVAYTVGLLATMFTRDHVRIGDLAGGTLLVYSDAGETAPEPVGMFPRHHELTPAAVEIIRELLRRWDTLDVDARERIARAALGNDTRSNSPNEALRAELERLVTADAARPVSEPGAVE